ncbi:MAG TPA: glycosyltransferase [Vicinamibacterales bacterium]|nr:glycosyltransferase [Vicinamibacterales bacterium]
MRILYLADIRFPLERANGIQSMETCHALASRGHHVMLAVRPDSQTPARDPFAFYGLPRLNAAEYADHEEHAAEHTDRVEYSGGSLAIEVAPITGPVAARRAGYLTFALGRSLGRGRQDLIFTRDLGLASMLLRLPRTLRAPVVYEAHTIAADEAAARPRMLTGATLPSATKLQRLAARERRVWSSADGYVTITAGLKTELERRFGPRPRIAVVPDGARAADQTDISATDPAGIPATDHTDPADIPAADDTDHAEQGPTRDSRLPGRNAQAPTGDSSQSAKSTFAIGYAGHLYPWKGVDLIIEAVTALQDTCALIIGGHGQEPDLARVKALAVELDCAARVSFTGLLPPPQVGARLREADVLVLPNPASAISSAFTSPLKLFEYMAAGKPIVASDLPAIREVLAHERNALLFEPGNPQALTAAIRRIKDDPVLAARLARQAAEDARLYTWARRAESLETLFREVSGVCEA